jgi:hypothetical protein
MKMDDIKIIISVKKYLSNAAENSINGFDVPFFELTLYQKTDLQNSGK